MRKSMESRSDYYRAIYVYKQRREKLREKYGIKKINKKTPEGYRKAVFGINNKIRIWRKAIKRIEHYNGLVQEVNRAIINFMGYDIRKTKRWAKDPRAQIARGIFSKYCIESRIPGPYLRPYLGTSKSRGGGVNKAGYETEIRRRFTRSFITNSENKELYHRFLKYIRLEE